MPWSLTRIRRAPASPLDARARWASPRRTSRRSTRRFVITCSSRSRSQRPWTGWRSSASARAGARGSARDVAGRLARHLREVERLERELEPAEPQARDVEQLVHQEREPPRLALERRRAVAERRREAPQRRCAARCRSWSWSWSAVTGRAQLVRGDREELVALAHLLLRLPPEPRPLLHLPPLGRVADGGDHRAPAVHLERREADLGRELAAVLAEPARDPARGPWAGAGRRLVAASGGPGAWRETAPGRSSSTGLPISSARRVAEQPLGVPVHEGDDPVRANRAITIASRHRLEQGEVHVSVDAACRGRWRSPGPTARAREPRRPPPRGVRPSRADAEPLPRRLDAGD